MTYRLAVAFTFAFAVLCSTFAMADEKAAEELLKTKGLKKLGNTFVVAEESAVTKALTELKKLQREVTLTGKKVAQLEAAYHDLNKKVTGAIQQQAVLSAQLPVYPHLLDDSRYETEIVNWPSMTAAQALSARKRSEDGPFPICGG